MPWRCGAGTTGPRFMALKCPNWMPTGRWSWTIWCEAETERNQSIAMQIRTAWLISTSLRQSPGDRSKPNHQHHQRKTVPQWRECSDHLPPSNGSKRPVQRRLGRLEWLCFDDKCNKLDALSCSSTLVSFFTRFQVSCADISPSCSHLMLDNSAGDIKG